MHANQFEKSTTFNELQVTLYVIHRDGREPMCSYFQAPIGVVKVPTVEILRIWANTHLLMDAVGKIFIINAQ